MNPFSYVMGMIFIVLGMFSMFGFMPMIAEKDKNSEDNVW